MALSAAGDTWGIPGPLFIWGMYVPAALVLVGLVLLLRRALAPGRRFAGDLHPYELAYLDGGPGRAVLAALTALRAEGAVEAAGGGKVRAVGDPPANATPLDRAVHGRLRDGAESPGDLSWWPSVRAELEPIRRSLVDRGLVLGPAARRARRLAALPLVALAALGVVRIVAGMAGGRPVAFLVLATIAVAVVALVLTFHWSAVTPEGKRELHRARTAMRHLDPVHSPAWTTYGASAATFAVALYGVPALTSFDPHFSAEAEMQRQFAVTTASSSSSSSSGSSTSGCGGGDGGGGGGGCGGGGGGGGGCGG
ncbi:hypothetical protein GCM10009678_81730 [Actinomadura kijaniata]|uniref:Uncharacterized protein (TIGR04222 family) n=1 Tax=Actinomadura namibiensis TaxID=182080 RepID=A0A7W3LSG6_ACTNM|nr:TIGR04222 domain-containing membrane protein [Actinomadura namibiensis]MBA8953506.1 uncharacterized protein (TIGR04222 family) [Actinomadura namibiensis]